MPKQTPQAAGFSVWLEHKVFASTEHILEMLAVERTGEYEALPQDLVASIHNEVLWQVVMRTNFPVNSLASAQDIEMELIRYLECSKDKAYMFFALCKQLAAWRPDDSIEPVVPPESDVDGPCLQPHAKVDETVTAETKHWRVPDALPTRRIKEPSMRDELGPQRFFDIERSDRIRSLVNRAVRLNNRAGIDEATIDDKGAVYCNDAQVEAELQQEYDRLEAEMRQVGMGLQETLGQIDDGNIVYDPMHEDPFGTSDLTPDSLPPDSEHLPDEWSDLGWHD